MKRRPDTLLFEHVKVSSSHFVLKKHADLFFVFCCCCSCWGGGKAVVVGVCVVLVLLLLLQSSLLLQSLAADGVFLSVRSIIETTMCTIHRKACSFKHIWFESADTSGAHAFCSSQASSGDV